MKKPQIKPNATDEFELLQKKSDLRRILDDEDYAALRIKLEKILDQDKLMREGKIALKKSNSTKKPQLHTLSLLADNLPVSWEKIVKTSAADYEDRINELWGAGKYRSAKWNQKLAWLCALSNLGHYLWLKAWKPVSTVFRRLL
jgi:hypothetical protein